MNKITFTINNKEIREGGDVFVIAEAGVNHNQNLDIALQLVDIAAQSGANAVKFQTFKAEQVVIASGEMADYQKKNIGKKQSQLEMLRSLELPASYYEPIIKRCTEKNIMFMSTPHGGKQSVDLLKRFGVAVYKIGSGDLTNYILLEKIAKTQKPIILSSGMATLEEVRDAISFLRLKGNSNIAILHCTTNYPCLYKEVNLLSMKTMMEQLDVPVGYSDHTQGIEVCIMAATLGMAVYECHFTTDRSLPGPDHIASVTPDQLKERIMSIRNVPIILGSSKKKPNLSEKKSMLGLIRRSIVYTRDLEVGKIITKKDLEAKRPGNGVSPKYYEHFLGKKLIRKVRFDQQLSFEDIEN